MDDDKIQVIAGVTIVVVLFVVFWIAIKILT